MSEHQQRRIDVVYVRCGQPRPYADHERVYRVEFFDFDWKGERPRPDAFGQYVRGEGVADDRGVELIPDDDPWWEKRADYEGAPSNREYAEQHDARLVELAKVIVGAPERTAADRDPNGGMSEWFRSYLDYAKIVAPGVVEVRIVEPYID